MSGSRVERSNGVGEIVLDAPDRANALDVATVESIERALDDLADTRCILLRAEGRNFCVGGDVQSFADRPADAIDDLARALHDMLRALAAVEVPVVAAVQGWAVGAGFSLALAADVLVVGADARFKTAYNRLGLTADGGMTWHLPRRLPLAVARDLLFTERTLDVEEALRYGLASRQAAAEALLDDARAVAAEIAGMSRPSTVTVKRLLGSAPANTLSDRLDTEAAEMVRAAKRTDGQEGIRAFLERRDPRFNPAP